MRKVLTIFGEVMSKKNSPRIVSFGQRKSIRPSKQYDKWAKNAKPQIVNVKPWAGGYPLAFGFFLYRKTIRAFDFNNLGQGLQDVLEETGIINGDDMKHVIPYPIGAGWAKDAGNPRAIIVLEDYRESPLFSDKMKTLYNEIMEL